MGLEPRGTIPDWFRNYLTNRQQFVAEGKVQSEEAIIKSQLLSS
jgi:cytochrome c-type biogenesis protein CcmE